MEDVDEVIDVFRDHPLDMQVEEQLALYVIPLQPVERGGLQEMRSSNRSRRPSVLGGAAINP